MPPELLCLLSFFLYSPPPLPGLSFHCGFFLLYSFSCNVYQRVPNLIGGRFVDSQSFVSIDVLNPVSVIYAFKI